MGMTLPTCINIKIDYSLYVSYFYGIGLHGLHHRDDLHQSIIFLVSYDVLMILSLIPDFMDDASRHPCDAQVYPMFTSQKTT